MFNKSFESEFQQYLIPFPHTNDMLLNFTLFPTVFYLSFRLKHYFLM
jgi:hypothetical protein